MATSGVTSFSVNELEVITDALQNLGLYGPGDSISADDVTFCRRKLNMLVKQWTAQIDFAPGLKMWTRRTAYVFLQSGQIEYLLGPTGAPTSEGEYVTTTLTAASPLSDLTLTVASIASIATTNFIGIELDSGAIQWTTVNGAPSGSVVTITTGLTGPAAIGRRVFVYAAKMRRPFEILSAVLRDVHGNDTPLDPNLSLGEYELIPSKSAPGTPGCLYFEAQRTNAKIYLDCAPDDVTNVIRLRYLSYIEDFTTNTGDVDFPAEWLRPLSAQLSIDCAPAFKQAVSPDLTQMRNDSLAIARYAYPAKSTAYFLSDPDCYD